MTSSFYGPIGLFSPVILTAKVVLQDIMRQNYSWADLVSRDIRFRQKWRAIKENLKVNDVVMIVDNRVQRGSCPLGRITATRPDRNGQVRTVEVMSQ